MKYESSTNRRLRDPSHAQELAVDAVQHVQGITGISSTNGGGTCSSLPGACEYRVVLGLGPGRSGTKSLTELLAAQTTCVHAEHEMVVKRRYRRDESGRIDPTSSMRAIEQEQNNNPPTKKKGSWGSHRRLEWDVPRLVRGAVPLTEQEEATWRVLRLLEQRYAFDEWAFQHSNNASERKPRKLGARGWRKHNSGGEDDTTYSTTVTNVDDNNEEDDGNGNGIENGNSADHNSVVAAVSSAGLAYVHEYIALDPTVRIVVLMRPREEVVQSFIKKSKGRNHWQKHERRRRSQDNEQPATAGEYVQPDKTWDSAFPNMSIDECRPHLDANDDSTWKPGKSCAIRAYWELYNDIVLGLCEQYPSNIRVFDMQSALNDPTVQHDLLAFCGFDEPVLDTSSEVHLNKKKK